MVLDASWSSAAHRALAARVAADTDADLVQLRCVRSPEVAAARIARRAATAGTDVSASAAVHQAMAARTDPWPDAADVATTVPLGEAVQAVRRFVS